VKDAYKKRQTTSKKKVASGHDLFTPDENITLRGKAP
jgi:hypothetical protein